MSKHIDWLSRSKVVSSPKVAPIAMVAQPKTTGSVGAKHSNRAAAPTHMSSSVLSRANSGAKGKC